MHSTTLREGRRPASRRLCAIRHFTAVLLSLLMVSCSSSVQTPVSGSRAATPIQPEGLETPTATDRSIIAQSDTLVTPTATATVAVPTPSPATTILPVTPTALPTATVTPPPVTETLWSYPVGIPGRPFGDGFLIRHVYAAENTWFSPGSWHTAEDWYLMEGDSTGARVYAAADGEVVFAGANYPGRVVIVQHAADLYSMYGHLDPQLAVQQGQRVARGDLLGTIARGDDRAAGHLHFEIRTFLTKRHVNGSAPRYRYKCGINCPLGPGYWPIDAPEHPSALGWRDPTTLINHRAFPSL